MAGSGRPRRHQTGNGEFAVAAQAAPANLQRAQAFLHVLLERPAKGHRFAHAFHLRGERKVGLREFLENASQIRRMRLDSPKFFRLNQNDSKPRWIMSSVATSISSYWKIIL
jgi:hypothetical protein